jgi:hypothetical protein
MDIAEHIAKYEDRGFTRERAEINVLMEVAAFAIFRDFPNAFVLFGGATLVLYHDSVRHSADLDLLSRASQPPSREEIVASLERGLTPLAQIMEMGSLHFEIDSSDNREGRIFVTTNAGRRLFRVDLTRFGAAIESKIEDHPIDGEEGISAVIKSATKGLLLLQKQRHSCCGGLSKREMPMTLICLRAWAQRSVQTCVLIRKILCSQMKLIPARFQIA